MSTRPPKVPVVTPQKTYSNRTVNVELEALKQRGLARILNKHFTETTARLEQEKAAADKAVQDLEERRARTSEFHASKNSQLSPLEEMALKANQWRAECRRKERETILLYQRYVHKFGDTGMVEVPQWVPPAHPDSKTTSAPAPKKAPKMVAASQVPSMAAQIEATLEEYLKQGALSYPSVQTHGRDETFQTQFSKEETQFRIYYLRMLEEKGIDVKSPEIKITERPDFPGFPIQVDPFERNVKEDVWKAHIDAAIAAAESANLPIDTVDEDNDMCSVVSGLTTLHSAMTREVLQDCERSVADFLREEKTNIRRMMEAEADLTSTTIGDVSMKATEEAENMVQQMEEILLEYQNTRSDAPKTREPRRYDTGNPNEEWMIYYDEFYQQEYYHEKNSNRTQWEPPDCCGSQTSDALSHSEVMPDAHTTSSSYRMIALNRKKRKLARRRKLVILSILTTLFATAAVLYVTTDRQVWEQQWNTLFGTKQKREVVVVVEQEPVVDLEEQVDEEEACLAEAALLEALRRPWLCNLPLAYLFHERCRILADRNPWFDLQELVNAMLQ